MHSVIVANGELIATPRLTELWRTADLRIAADGGAVNARRHLTLAPHVVIGDFDSLDDATRTWCASAEFIQHPRDKDETDLELALELAHTRGATTITILGAAGGRFDQAFANVMLLAKLASAHIAAKIAGANFDAWVAWARAEVAGQIGDTVSLIPLTERVEPVTTSGLDYPLRGETLYLGYARGVSNRLVETNATVAFANGLLLIVHLHD